MKIINDGRLLCKAPFLDNFKNPFTFLFYISRHTTSVGGQMDKEQIQSALLKAKDISEKRNFKQSFDLIINLKGIDLKKPEHQIDTFITLPHPRGKKAKICALVGPELAEQAKEVCDSVLLADNFDRYKEKKEIKKIANSFDYFI
ncbi:hypothetical protein HYW72_00735, partial [Candidatus Nomurabacteria bacterium]|nr:hypothetical protein [Candidatus Nomurabacteria bacterium]